MIKNNPKDLKIDVERLNGFYRGVVEDNVDPLKAGRVRVRIHGIHTAKKVKSTTEGIPTDELPWAEPCMPIHEGSVSGFGSWAVPLQGSQVMLFFENGNLTQPRYFASMPGIPEAQEQYSTNSRATTRKDGFRDPNGEYPVKGRLGEPDVHRLARGVTDQTLVTTKNQNRTVGVQTAFGGQWSEPASPYEAQYPHNHVIATHGGITIELDSTPGSTRLHLYHPSNSYIEIDNDGNMVVKNNTEKYEIVAGGKNIYIKQQRNLTIDEDSRKKVDGAEGIEVTGNKTESVGGTFSQTVSGNKEETLYADKTEDITGSKTVTIGVDKSEDVTGNKTETVDGDKSKTISGNETDSISGDKTESVNGNLNLTVFGDMDISVVGSYDLSSIGGAEITSPTIRLSGATTIVGGFTSIGGGGGSVAGNIIVTSGDVTADGISLKNHVHADPQGGLTGPAQ